MRAITIAIACFALAGCESFGFGDAKGPPPAYVVFFPGSSLDIPPDAQGIVRTAAQSARTDPGQIVEVAGPSTKIAPHYNPGLAEPRIAAVERALIANGVPKDHIVRAELTTEKLKTDITGAQRVEIHLVQHSAQ
jgi:outer membrane protein OmpA-like peptidoglycan-associated protein